MKTGLLALGRQRLERLVVLVDVQVFAQGNVNYAQAYAALIHSCIERTLGVCNEHCSRQKSTTTWGYKLFDSSLSPLASSSTIQKLLRESSGGLKHIAGFKPAEENLGLFQRTLCTVAAKVGTRSNRDSCRSKADFVVRALQELLSDFAWNSVSMSEGSSSDEEQVRRKRGGDSQAGASFSIEQNLVMVFSHLPENVEQFSSFMNISTSQDVELLKGFSSKIKRLQEPFQLRGIRACWINMPLVATSVVVQGSGLPVPAETEQRRELQGVFAQAKWKYMTMDALAIASECLPPAMVWSSVAYPDLQVHPNAQLGMQAKLRISVQDRDGKRFQPDICRLQVVPLGSNILNSSLMKESVSAILKTGSLSSKAERFPLMKCQPPVVKIVVKSLLLKQDVSFKCSLRYLLYHRTECGTRKKPGSGEKRAQQCLDSLADDATSDNSGHDILKQLQQEPMRFEPGDRAWQVLLIAIARKRSVAEVDLFIDGNCTPAILEPITVQCAALSQTEQSSKSLASESSMRFLALHSGSKSLATSPLLQTLVKSGEGAEFEGGECVPVKLKVSPKKRTASTIPVEEYHLYKREKLLGELEQKPNGAEEINHIRREAYSWVQHWRYILRRKVIGVGMVQIENRYMRPRFGKKPSKAIQIIKCWLDQASKLELQLIPFSPATPGYAGPEPVIREQVVDGGLKQLGASEKVGLFENSFLPLRDKDLFSAILDTEEHAKSYLSSVEQMLQDCLQSDAGDLQVFVKGIMCNATRAQRILLKKKQAMDLIRPLAEIMPCPVKDDDTHVHGSAHNILRGETAEACNSDSSCASNISKAEKSDHYSGVKLGIVEEMLCSVSGVGNGAIPDSNCLDYGGVSDGADSAGQMALVESGVGSGNLHEATDESQSNCDESVLSAMVAEQLMDKLLVRPKKLAKQYKDSDPAAPDIAHIRTEKLRAYEIQILFRMELIERDCDGPLEKEKTKILKEICRLLDDIQFDLGGGVFGSESLHDYSIRVIHNRYKKRLPQTVADIFERMEFNGYVEGVSEPQAAPDFTHAPADLVGFHDPKETGKEELIDNFTTMDAATRRFVPAVQTLGEEKHPSGAILTSSKGRTQKKSRRKRSVPLDAFTRASEKRKLASRLAHFGGPESLHRLKKVKFHHHQSPKPPKVSSSVKEKYQSKEHNVVLETPRFERQSVRAETPKSVYEEDEVESVCTRAITSAFGFGTPARVAKHIQASTRKRRLALFTQKKPPGRGLPRIPRDMMQVLAGGETKYWPAKPEPHQLDAEILTHNEGARESNSLSVSQSSQEQRLPDPEWRRKLSADVLEEAGAATFDSTDLTRWVLRESGDRGSPEKNESRRHTESSEKLVSSGQVSPYATRENKIIQEDDCDPERVSATQVGLEQRVVHVLNSSTLMNSSKPISVRKNKRKTLHTCKSRKPDSLGDCPKPQNSAPGTQILSPPAAERDHSVALGNAAQEPVPTVEMSAMAKSSQPVNLTSLENRWDDDEIPCSLSMNCVSGQDNVQHTLAETQSIDVAVDSDRNGSSANLAKRHGFLSASHSEELASRPAPKASSPHFSELGSETEILFETQEVLSQKHRFRSPRRALYEDTLCLSLSDAPSAWEMPFMDLNGTQEVEQDRVGTLTHSMPTPEKLPSPGSCNLYAASLLRLNQMSEVRRVDPTSSPSLHRLAAEVDVPPVKALCLITEDSEYLDLDYTQILNEIFHSTHMMVEADAQESGGRGLDAAGECFDDYALLLDENWDPLPRLKPEARLSARSSTDFQRKKGALDEETVAAIVEGSPPKLSSPTLARKFRRLSGGSPGQHPHTPNASVNCKKRPRSNTTSPKETPKEKRNKMLRFT